MHEFLSYWYLLLYTGLIILFIPWNNCVINNFLKLVHCLLQQMGKWVLGNIRHWQSYVSLPTLLHPVPFYWCGRSTISISRCPLYCDFCVPPRERAHPRLQIFIISFHLHSNFTSQVSWLPCWKQRDWCSVSSCYIHKPSPSRVCLSYVLDSPYIPGESVSWGMDRQHSGCAGSCSLEQPTNPTRLRALGYSCCVPGVPGEWVPVESFWIVLFLSIRLCVN